MIKLTIRHLEFMMKINENEILQLPPIKVRNSQHANYLLKNGLIYPFPIIKNKAVCWKYRITIKGENYLNKINHTLK